MALPPPAAMTLLPILLLVAAAAAAAASSASQPLLHSITASPFSRNPSLFVERNDFPCSFKFGALTWAMKHEAASFEDGKSDGIWDVYARQKGTVYDGTTPSQGGDHYHRYSEDIDLLVDVGMDSYKFSIAWTRMFPNGSGEVNVKAVDHYNDVINKLIDAGVEPFVFLYEQELPQVLEDSYGGLLSPLFIDDFVHFANACFNAFGDRVKHWGTFEEGNDLIPFSYAGTWGPPGRCTPGLPPFTCSAGNSSTEPYIAAHNMLLAHAAAVELYRKDYQPTQEGEIGMSIWFKWYEPLTNSTEDFEAAKRAAAFTVGWFLEPLFYGDYPSTMKEVVGSRLPSFTEEESARIRGSVDFIGLNTVTAIYVTNNDEYNVSTLGYFQDWGIKTTANTDGGAIGPLNGYREGVAVSPNEGEYVVPWCMEKVVGYMKTHYDNIPTYITALGHGLNSTAVNDSVVVEFFSSYLKSLIVGIRDGADVRGLFVWSLIDGFETIMGLHKRFGMYYVDDDFQRFPRSVAFWFKDMLASNATTLAYKS